MTVAYTPIGTIHSPFTSLDGMPIQPLAAADVRGTIVIETQYQAGLKDLDGFSHIILIYHFHRSTGYRLAVTPFLDTVQRGLFATRAPRRPNPIGLSVVRLIAIEGPVLQIQEVDVLDGTPLLDIKPWVPAFDTRENARSGWLEQKQTKGRSAKSDRRFVDKNR